MKVNKEALDLRIQGRWEKTRIIKRYRVCGNRWSNCERKLDLLKLDEMRFGGGELGFKEAKGLRSRLGKEEG